jgi:hypothetical protein
MIKQWMVGVLAMGVCLEPAEVHVTQLDGEVRTEAVAGGETPAQLVVVGPAVQQRDIGNAEPGIVGRIDLSRSRAEVPARIVRHCRLGNGERNQWHAPRTSSHRHLLALRPGGRRRRMSKRRSIA